MYVQIWTSVKCEKVVKRTTGWVPHRWSLSRLRYNTRTVDLPPESPLRKSFDSPALVVYPRQNGQGLSNGNVFCQTAAPPLWLNNLLPLPQWLIVQKSTILPPKHTMVRGNMCINIGVKWPNHAFIYRSIYSTVRHKMGFTASGSPVSTSSLRCPFAVTRYTCIVGYYRRQYYFCKSRVF